MANSIATGVAYADPAFTSVQVGTSSVPVQITAAGVLNGSYAKTSAASGDTRLAYQKLIWTSTGSGEVVRGYAQVTGTGGATAGTINGAHFTVGVDGGTISGAANAIRATVGGTTAAPGGTLSSVQLDSNFGAGVTLPAPTAFMRVTNSGTVKVTNFLNMPAPGVGQVLAAKVGTPTQTHSIKFVDDAGTTYYIMCTTTA